MSVVEEMNRAQRVQVENDTTASPRAFFNTDGSYNQNVIAKTKLTDVDISKLIENRVAFTNEQIGNMNEKQLSYALDALMPSFTKEIKNNKAFAEVPLLIEKAQKTSDIKGMRDYVKMMQAQVTTNDETSNALVTNVEDYRLRDEGDGGRIEAETQIKQSRQETEEQTFFNKINEIGKQSDLSKTEKVEAIQQAFETLADKWDVLVPADVKFLTAEGFDEKGKPDYDFPGCLGFVPETVRAITRDSFSTSIFSRMGSKYGNNASTQRSYGLLWSIDELGLPYLENYSARHTFEINDTYFDAIDAIRENSLDGLNEIIEQNHGKPVDLLALDSFKAYYQYFTERAETESKKHGVNADVTYGLNGEVAPWINADGEVYLNGGAPQFTFPLNIDMMLRLGVISRYE